MADTLSYCTNKIIFLPYVEGDIMFCLGIFPGVIHIHIYLLKYSGEFVLNILFCGKTLI